MPAPHKHAELIKKWADDPTLVFEYYDPDNPHSVWRWTSRPAWISTLLYRIKPTIVKREGWALLHLKPTYSGCWATASNVFPTEQEAINAGKDRYHIAKVEWKEEV